MEPVSDIPQSFTPNTARQDYDLREEMIPMRDGVKLHTLIFTPRGLPLPAPLLMTRTPYGASGPITRAFPSTHLAALMGTVEQEFFDAGYIRVVQDIRGKFKSEGVYQMYRPPIGPTNALEVDHATDTYDTIDWLVKNVPGNNGRAGVMGVSYPGYLALTPLFAPHPALKALVPINPVVDLWMGDDFYHNGAFRLSELEYFYRQTMSKDNSKLPPFGVYDLYDFYLRAGNAENAAKEILGDQPLPAWDRMGRDEAYSAQWQSNAVDVQLARLKALDIPVMNVHSWFDAEDIYGPFAAHKALQAKDRDGKAHLAAGPWTHGQSMRGDGSASGKIRWDADTSLWFRQNVLIPFLDEHLKDIAPAQPIPKVVAFETGANKWHSLADWKPAGKISLHLGGAGALGFAPLADGNSFGEFVSDPAKPVPYRVRPILSRYRDGSTWSAWLLDDQRPFADRPDVLTFVTAPLAEPITLRGNVAANLVAATTGTDADWIVKLIDVYPDEYPRQPELGGYQLMVSHGIARGRYRQSFERPEAITPNTPLAYRVRMTPMFHTFKRGHRLMAQIQSSWFPLFDRNPQTFVPSIFAAPPEAYQKQTHRIFLSSVIEVGH